MTDTAAVARFYGKWARLYDLLATRTPGIGAVRGRAAAAMALAPGETAVEVGCGTGANLPHLRERVGDGGRVVGVDLAEGMLERARRRRTRRGWANVHLVRGDGARPPVASGDAVLATFVVGMFEEPAAAVDAWCDLVGPGGRVVLLDAAPRERAGPLDAAFRGFVAASAPPTTRLRYETSPARRLSERVAAARTTLEGRAETVAEERFARGFVRLAAATVAG